MKKSDYDVVLNKFKENNQYEYEVFSYSSMKQKLSEMRKMMPKKNKSYSNEKEIIELYALSLGFIALSLRFNDDNMELKDRNDCTIYTSMLTNISNTILSILKLLDNGFEFQAKVLIRNLMELLFTLLVLLINKEKRIQYFDSARLENSYSVWQNSIKMSKLNEELANFEKDFFDEEFQTNLKDIRKNMYKYYSSHAHNDFFYMFSGGFSIKDDEEEDSNHFANYNLWGNYNYESKDILESLYKLLCMFSLYFKYIVSKKEFFDKDIYLSKEMIIFWNSGFFLLFMLQYILLPNTKDL